MVWEWDHNRPREILHHSLRKTEGGGGREGGGTGGTGERGREEVNTSHHRNCILKAMFYSGSSSVHEMLSR